MKVKFCFHFFDGLIPEGWLLEIAVYRTELHKPFTFRVWTEQEFEKIVKPNGYKIIN